MQIAFLFDPNCWDGQAARFDQIVQADGTFRYDKFPLFEEDADVLHLVGGHAIHELHLQLVNVVSVLENVENVLVFHQFIP